MTMIMSICTCPSGLASGHQMDTDNGANHVYVDVADDGAKKNDGDGDDDDDDDDGADNYDGDGDDVTWIQTHLPREITPVMQSTTDR